MEPVLTQEELEAIYSAMKGDDGLEASVDDLSLTAGHEFISRAESAWTEATKAMAGHVETILTGGLGRRTFVEVQTAEALEDYSVANSTANTSPDDNTELDESDSEIAVITIGDMQVFLGIDRMMARKYVARKTGEPSNTEEEEETTDESNTLTVLEHHLLRELMLDLAMAASGVTPIRTTASLVDISCQDAWAKRSRDKLWVSTTLFVKDKQGPGVWFRGPASVFLPKPENTRQTLADRLKLAQVALSTELGRFKISVSDLWKLHPGALIQMDTTVGDPLKVLVGGVLKLEGEPMVSRGNIAIQVKGRASNKAKK